MKKTIVFLVLALAFVACQKKQYFSSSAEIDLVKKGADSYLKSDWATLRSLYADTAKIMINTWEKTMTADEFIDWEKQGVGNYSSYKIGDDGIYEMVVTDDNQHWVHTWINHTSTFKNGKSVSVPVHISSRVEGGKVVFQGFILDNLQGYLASQDSTAGK